MISATVVGSVWSTRRLAEMPNGALLEVAADNGGPHFIAFDVLGSGLGERVLIAQGSVAAAWFAGKPPPIDALIVGSIDSPPADGITSADELASKSTDRRRDGKQRNRAH